MIGLRLLFAFIFVVVSISCSSDDNSLNSTEITGYPIVDTNQNVFFDNTNYISEPSVGDNFYGQDANYSGNLPSYTDNGDGTITDNVTGLMWQQSCDTNGDGVIDINDKMTYYEALENADSFDLAGYNDWRLPSIKELYSLMDFSGVDPSGNEDEGEFFIDDEYFEIGYGDVNAGERLIDSQFATTSIYVDYVFENQQAMFGLNLVDGRIKGYPTDATRGRSEGKKFYVLYVRGNESYGVNDFQDNSDGTITDNATGLMWTQDDSGEGMNWKDALEYAENYEFAGYSDWRLPNAKELQSIIDYTRSPATTNSAAIDPLFNCSEIVDEGGNTNYPFYWSSTTHINWTNQPGTQGVYLAFGEALGFMEMPPMSGQYNLMDVHGAGAQRSDPKDGDPSLYPYGHGPQGDVIRIFNHVRLVRDK